MIRIGSLFSGIGGLELGVIAAFAEAGIPARVEWQVEIDPFCRAILARHFPDTDRSVTDVRAASALRPVNIICGGFPCQDVSAAGKGEGLSGERSGLWWAYRDIVRALQPDGVLVENVASGLPRWHGPVRCSLEAMGYRTWARQISAADVGAPHRRERVFVLAHAQRVRRQWSEDTGAGFDDSREERGGLFSTPRGRSLAYTDGKWGVESQGHELDERRSELRIESGPSRGADRACASEPRDAGQGLADAASERWHEGQRRERETGGRPIALLHGSVGDTDSARSQERQGERRDARAECPPALVACSESGRLWEAQSGLGGGAHGLPAGLDIPARWPAGRGEEQAEWEPPRTVAGKEPLRRARLKALGNAVVPAQGREAMRWALDVLRGAA